MAKVPYTGVPTVEPSGAPPNDYQNITPFPGAFGGVTGQAERQAGGEVQQGADALMQDAILRQQRFNDHVVTDSVNQLQTKAEALTYGDPSDSTAPPGLYTLKGQDALRAGPQVAQHVNDLRDQISSGLQNDAQRLAFQKQTVRYLQYKRAEIESHINQQSNKFGADSETSAIAAAGTIAGNNYASDDNIGSSLKDAMLHGAKRVLLNSGHPPDPATASADDVTDYNNLLSQGQRQAAGYVVQRAVMGAMAGDPVNGSARANDIVQKFGSLIDPDMRETLTRVTKEGADQAKLGGDISAFWTQHGAGATAPQPGTPAQLNPASTARALQVHDEAVKQGASDAEGWGWAANAVHESGALVAPVPGDGGISHGMFQLNKDQLARYQATHNGHLPEQDDLATQLAFARSQAAPSLVGAAGPDGYAAAISKNFEVPANGVMEASNRAATALTLASTGGPAGPGQPIPQIAPSGHSPESFTQLQQLTDDAYKQSEQLYPNNPRMQNQFVAGIRERVNNSIMLNSKYDAEVAKQKRDNEEAWGTGIMTALQADPQHFDPSVVWSTPGAGGAVDWEKREQMSRVVAYQLQQHGIQNTAEFGPGYSDVFKSIVGDQTAPNAIHSLADIWSRSGPNGDLTLPGVKVLMEAFRDVHKNPDESGVRTVENGMMEYAKGQLWKPAEMGGIKDQAGLDIYNGKFLPAFVSGFDKWREKHPDDPYGFLNQTNMDKMLSPLKRNPTQEANDRLAETGGLAPGKTEPEGTPMPAPPPGINAGEWNSIGTSRPFAENGQPYTHAAWGKVLQTLMADPEKNGPWFDQRFGPAGYTAADIVPRLKGINITPQDAAPPGGAMTAPGPE